MRSVAIFCEDSGHEAVIAGIIRKLSSHKDISIQVRSARNGRGRALTELRIYLERVMKEQVQAPDILVVAIDANCKGYHEKRREIDAKLPTGFPDHIPLIHAIPDPHIERWMLIDAAAFKAVFGKGCKPPDKKCEKDRYKKLLNDAILAADGEITISWVEHAEALLERIDIETLSRNDESARRFTEELKAALG